MVAQRKLPSRESLSYRFRQYWPAYILLLPVVAWYIIFCYAPMGGLVIAFKKYSVLAGIGASRGLVSRISKNCLPRRPSIRPSKTP